MKHVDFLFHIQLCVAMLFPIYFFNYRAYLAVEEHSHIPVLDGTARFVPLLRCAVQMTEVNILFENLNIAKNY